MKKLEKEKPESISSSCLSFESSKITTWVGRVAQLAQALRYKQTRSRARFPMGFIEIFH
jgi:hypothetical protein